jgi:hypothetical protein
MNPVFVRRWLSRRFADRDHIASISEHDDIPARVESGEPARRDRLYELVLPAWHDKPGSKLHWSDYARAMVDLGYIWRERLGHQENRR